MNGFYSVGYFLVASVFSIIIFILWARLFIRYFAVSVFHPFSQTIYKLTSPLIGPIQRNIIRQKSTKSRYDIACLMLLILCELIKFTIINFLFLKQSLPFSYIILYTIVDLIVQPCNLLFYAIIIRVVMSWLNPNWQDPFASLLLVVTEPILRTIRNKLPNTGMLDLSPIVAIFVLKAITIFFQGVVPFQLA